MNRESKKRIVEAVHVLERYRRALVERMAMEILERRDEFENPFIGGADGMMEKYYHLLSCLSAVSAELAQYLPQNGKGASENGDRPTE